MCQILKEETKCLGFVINKKGMKLGMDKVEGISKKIKRVHKSYGMLEEILLNFNTCNKSDKEKRKILMDRGLSAISLTLWKSNLQLCNFLYTLIGTK